MAMNQRSGTWARNGGGGVGGARFGRDKESISASQQFLGPRGGYRTSFGDSRSAPAPPAESIFILPIFLLFTAESRGGGAVGALAAGVAKNSRAATVVRLTLSAKLCLYRFPQSAKSANIPGVSFVETRLIHRAFSRVSGVLNQCESHLME